VTPPQKNDSLGPMVQFLKENRGFDFSAYKDTTLRRRVMRRVQAVGLEDIHHYIAYLEGHPEEFAQLLDVVLINLTGFFRDKEAWDYLAAEIVPRIVASKKPTDQVRVWSAGCSSGQEAYSLAMLFGEATDRDTFEHRVKIYATDVDEEALSQARHAAYSAKEVEDIPAVLRAKYLDKAGSSSVFKPWVRRSLIFGRNDLTRDAPISRLDLLVCRNTLMYFNLETQGRILKRLRFALRDDGYLFLGKAEMILALPGSFVPVDIKHRVFSRVPPSLGVRAQLSDDGTDTGWGAGSKPPGRLQLLRDATLESGSWPLVVVDPEGRLALANEKARTMFGLSPDDLERPFRDLELSYWPVELRSMIKKAVSDSRPVRIQDVEFNAAHGGVRYLDVEVSPLLGNRARSLGVAITFIDATRPHKLREEIETTRRELEGASEELQSANEELQTTNEEAETMNEELQATNEELQTMNDELRRRTEDLTQVKSFLESTLASVRVGVIVVDREMKVLLWNARAADFWGLRPDEVRGRSFVDLDMGLPIESLLGPLRKSLAEGSPFRELAVRARDRKGRAFDCRITLTPSLGPDGTRQGVVMVMEDAESAPPEK
jgi:two-component system CheB/CheR fusion protein